VVLAWSILMMMIIIVVAAGKTGPAHPVQANIRIASSTTHVTLASTLSAAVAPGMAAAPAARYVVQPGDTLSGIAARFAVRGGWPALYAANRQIIGPDPDTIEPGVVLTIPPLAAAAPPAPGPARGQPHPAPPPPSPPAGHRHHPWPVTTRAPAATGMPPWLKVMLLAVGLLILVAFLAEPVAAARGRRQQAAVQAVQLRKAGFGQEPGSRQLGAQKARIILADHDRLVVTRSRRDNTICVLRRPGEDPIEILRVARLVMPEGPYEELAEQLGLPASLPMK
jgi:LysM repeat protein